MAYLDLDLHAMNETTVSFHQTLHPRNLGTCLSEILKYVLYVKGQIPLPYNQLVKEKTSEELNHWKSYMLSRREKRFWERVKKLQQCLSCIHSMCSEAGPSIQEMVVVLGGTLVSPKEVYKVKIETGLVDSNTAVLSQENLTRFVVKNLVSIGLDANPRTLSLTNCFVLFRAPRLAKFGTPAFPRMSFKVLQKGSHVCLHLNLDGIKNGAARQDLRHSASVESVTVGEGIADHPLAGDVQEQGMHKKEAEPKVEEELVHSLAGFSLDENKKDDYVWFQITTVFQGFKELPLASNSKNNWSDGDIWARS